MSEQTEVPGTETPENGAGTMPTEKLWQVDVLETAKRVVTVASFTRSEAKHRAKNAAFWLAKSEATETVKSKPSGTPVEVDGDGVPIPEKPKPTPTAASGKK